MTIKIWGQRHAHTIITAVAVGAVIASVAYTGSVLVLWLLALVFLGNEARVLDKRREMPRRQLVIASALWVVSVATIGITVGDSSLGFLAILNHLWAIVLIVGVATAAGMLVATWRWPAIVAVLWSLLVLGREAWLRAIDGHVERVARLEAVLPPKYHSLLFSGDAVHPGVSDVAALTLIGAAPLVAAAALGTWAGRYHRGTNPETGRVGFALVGVALVAGMVASGGDFAGDWSVALLAVVAGVAAFLLRSVWSLLTIPFAAYLGELLVQAVAIQRDGMTATWNAIDTDGLFEPVTFNGVVWLWACVTVLVVILPTVIGAAIGRRRRVEGNRALPRRIPALRH